MEATQHRGRVRVRRRRGLRRRTWLGIGFAGAVGLAVVGVLFLHAAWRQGQGLAHVDGAEITQEDLLAEARARKVSATAAAPALLDAVLSRELLAQEARRRGLDRRPTFPSDRRRAVEQTLASALLAATPLPATPTQAEIEGYIARHPDAFSARRRLIVQAVSFAAEADPVSSGVSWEDLERRLQAARLPHRRDDYVFTTADAPPPLRAALPSAVVGGLISVAGGGFVTVYRVMSIEPSPVEGPAAVIAARAELDRAAREAQIAHLLDALRHTHRVHRSHLP